MTLLHAKLPYPTAALVRQLVEVEYLLSLFETDAALASQWLAGSPEQLRTMFRPAAMRTQSNGKFRASEYWSHCENGGHPHPRGAALLPCHSDALADNRWLWGDLAQHLDRLWRSLEEAIPDEWPSTDRQRAVGIVLAGWYAVDHLAHGVLPPGVKA